MFYIDFVSASEDNIIWMRSSIENNVSVKGYVDSKKRSGVFRLRYAKGESLKVLEKMYKSNDSVCLSRKKLKVQQILAIVATGIL